MCFVFHETSLKASQHWFTHMKCINQATFTYAQSGCGVETGGFWHSHSTTTGMFTHTRSGHGRICHFLRTKMVWSTRFQSERGKLGVGPICCRVDFAFAPLPLRDRVCVKACDDLCRSQFSARLCPRPLRACVNIPLGNKHETMIDCMTTSQYLHQCWITANWIPMNKLWSKTLF